MRSVQSELGAWWTPLRNQIPPNWPRWAYVWCGGLIDQLEGEALLNE